MGNWDETYIMAAVSMPIYWSLIMWTHAARAIWGMGNKGFNDIIHEPRKHWEEVSKDNSNQNAAFIRRATAAHQNGWENFTVFLSAAFAGVVGNVDHSFYNTCCAIVLVSRFFYNVNYLMVERGLWSHGRSACFMIGNGACFALWIKAAMEIAQ